LEDYGMNTFDMIEDLIRERNGIISTKEIDAHRIERWYLTEMVRRNRLERVCRGVYLDPSYGNYDEYYILQLKNARCVFSYSSALYLHELTDRIPPLPEITVPRGYNASHLKGKAMVHSLRNEWYTIGITDIKTTQGNSVKAYDAERTLCDLLRDRKHQDVEVFVKAFTWYFKRPTKDIWKLRAYAKQFGVSEELESIVVFLTYQKNDS
jgi:predicted transcriptional regulator of viral defense system